MNGAHLHLVVNHVSLFALLFGAVTLIVSMKQKSVDLRVLATTLFVIAAVFGWVAFETGEKAEDVIKALGGNTETFISAHAQAAEWAFRSSILVGILSIATEWAIRKKKKFGKVLQWALLVFALHGCTVFAVTAMQGGKISHTEVRD
ncbi:MAG: hypothetical protein AB7F43_08020 [Bacteriovoracia bacterium]